MEMHQGTVRVESGGMGKGCRFTITLPRTTVPRRDAPRAPAPHSHDAPALPPAEAAAARGARTGRRILLVEDQPDARRALQRLLQMWGHTVESAGDGIIGLERALSFVPEIGLIDVGLPGLDGYELARRIRASLGNRVRLVALTGYGQREDRERAYAAGFDLHLIKPVDRDELARALDGGDMMCAHHEDARRA
jgi:CheY-like chemotaxis protein